MTYYIEPANAFSGFVDTYEPGLTMMSNLIRFCGDKTLHLSLILISEPTRLDMISSAVFCVKNKNICTILHRHTDTNL